MPGPLSSRTNAVRSGASSSSSLPFLYLTIVNFVYTILIASVSSTVRSTLDFINTLIFSAVCFTGLFTALYILVFGAAIYYNVRRSLGRSLKYKSRHTMARKYSSAGGSSPVTVQDEEYIEISSDSDSDCTLKGDNEISQKRLPVVAPAHKKPGLAHKKLGGLVHKKPPVDIPVHQKSGLAREKLGGLAHENLGIGASSPGAVQRHECIDLSSDTDCSEDSDNTLTGDSGNIRKMSGMDLSADGGDEKRVPGSEKSVDSKCLQAHDLLLCTEILPDMDTSPDREAETKGVPESAKTAGEEASKERVHESEKAVDSKCSQGHDLLFCTNISTEMDLSPEGEADRKGVPESEKTAGGEASKERVPESEKTAESKCLLAHNLFFCTEPVCLQ